MTTTKDCSFVGCGRPHYARSLCQTHSAQVRRGRPLTAIMQPLPPTLRVLSKILVSDGCWKWEGSHVLNGYGNVWWDGRVQYAHRVVYELLVGPIPEGLTIDHLCRVRDCVNPSHLEAVTHKENVRRGDAGKWKRS